MSVDKVPLAQPGICHLRALEWTLSYHWNGYCEGFGVPVRGSYRVGCFHDLRLINSQQAFGRPVRNMKKFEEGVFSDLRNLKPGVDACLEEPKVCSVHYTFISAGCLRAFVIGPSAGLDVLPSLGSKGANKWDICACRDGTTAALWMQVCSIQRCERFQSRQVL